MSNLPRVEEPTMPSGGWSSLKEVGQALFREGVPLKGARVLLQQNQTDGFACVSCAWAKPAQPRTAEFCEAGAKATAWELTDKRMPAGFFDSHTLTELETWSDHELESGGRLTVPLRWNRDTDRYEEVSWEDAFTGIGAELRTLRAADPKSVVFYASGRASLEASYMYQLLARLYGNNNLPDSSNMCHESTSMALPETIGVPVGTVHLDDFAQTEAIFFFGQNVGVSSPRMLHPLQEARQRGVPIVTFNPLKERGLVSFVNPQSPVEMLTPAETCISTQYLQVRVGGDIAAITGLCKWLIQADDDAIAQGTPRVLDADFIAQQTHGFEAFADFVRATSWAAIERESGLTRAALEAAAAVFAKAKAVLGIYGMGLTQHRKGVQNVQMVSNLLLLGGHIGRPGAGICPVRGHSNVQGQRTVGITEKPALAPLDKLAELYGFEPPRGKGLTTVESCQGMLDGSVRAFIGLGGNFLRAVPDTRRMEAAWRRLRLTVNIATKLNRGHLVHGEASYLLPCLGRIEIDRQASGAQLVSVEDSTGFIHASRGVTPPAEATLRSEVAIVAGIAQATLEPNAKVPWQQWTGDYAQVRDAIEKTWPAIFGSFNTRFLQAGGFPKPNPARTREWKTSNGKANFIVPDALNENPDLPGAGGSVLQLMTMRSDDQFNTTIYSLDDRFRGIYGSRQVLLMNALDMVRLGLTQGEVVDVVTVVTTRTDEMHAGDAPPAGLEATPGEPQREVKGFRVTRYDIPQGCLAGYFPECNPLIPLSHHAERSQVPAAKSIPVRLVKAAAAATA